MSGKGSTGKLILENVNCGKDPEFPQTATGKERVKFSVAFEKAKGDVTLWFNCNSFDEKVIDTVREFVHKGTKGITLEAYPDPFKGSDGGVVCMWKVTDISLADGQTAHGTAKANGYAPEPIVKEPEGEDDADMCPF